MKVLGFGIQQSRGVKSGVIVDLSAAEQAIRLAVAAADTMANLVVDIVNFSCRGMKSAHVIAQIPIGERTVTIRDIRRVLSEGSRLASCQDRPVIYSMPVSFRLDGEQDVADPRDMIGRTLGVDMHVITAAAAPLRNLEHCINRAHLSVEHVVVTPLASALSSLVEDEAELGVVCVDFGGETTATSVFSTILDDQNMVTLPSLHGMDGHISKCPRSILSHIIRARVEELGGVLF
ncbi:MAG: cell division protein FtsA [Candidatus Tokpelaia sp. JSC085]|nr:MAG: cell division protein FtsA [Candidatus Tokpelaia sp. JSC085]